METRSLKTIEMYNLLLFPILLTIILVPVITHAGTYNICLGDSSLVCSSDGSATIVKDKAISSDDRFVNFFGLNLIWWEVDRSLINPSTKTVDSNVLKILSNSGVSFYRYHGGTNELDWTKCIGGPEKRVAQKLVSWEGNLKCSFGIDEFERFNDQVGVDITWYTANLTGFQRNINPLDTMIASNREWAAYVKKIANNKKRFWELGNEIDRGWIKWDAPTITERSTGVTKAILEADPHASVVLPLIEFKPSWMKSDYEHNRYLIRAHKNFLNNFSIHLYYDNPPEGPSVINRLNYVRGVASILKEESVSDPSIWITEHARWPKGNPEDRAWRNNWFQTGNHDAVLAISDFLIGLTQIPEVKGAFLHGLRAGPWNYINYKNDTYTKTQLTQLYEFLYDRKNWSILPTKTITPLDAQVLGGYSVRTVVFANNRAAGCEVILAVNRSKRSIALNFPVDKNNYQYQITVENILDEEPDNSQTLGQVIKNKSLQKSNLSRLNFTLPMRSVSKVQVCK